MNIQSLLELNSLFPESKYVQLATVDKNNQPSVRTVVFREFVQSTSDIIIHTDIRSEKMRHLSHCRNVQICWYFSQSREQFRISGDVEMVDSNNESLRHLRVAQWQKLSKAAKSAYFAGHPGTTLPLDDVNQHSVHTQNDFSEVSNKFVLLLVRPHQVDHLDLKTNPHTRIASKLENNFWQEKRLNP